MGKQKIPDWVQQIKNESDAFWKNEYPLLKGDEKIVFWIDYIARTMHAQGEQTGDEYSAFTPTWYHKNMRRDTDFPQILKSVLLKLGSKVDMKVFYAAIGVRGVKVIPKKPSKNSMLVITGVSERTASKTESAAKAKMAVAALAKAKK